MDIEDRIREIEDNAEDTSHQRLYGEPNIIVYTTIPKDDYEWLIDQVKDLDAELTHVSKVLAKCSQRLQKYRERERR